MNIKIESLKTHAIHEIHLTKSKGENAMPCPSCSSERKHKNKKSFSWNIDKETGYCHNCDESFIKEREKQEKRYSVPEPVNNTNLSDKAVKYFEGRMISKETLNAYRIYTSMEYMPQTGTQLETICFPFFRNNKLINIKYRSLEKHFKLHKDAELIFWNQDCLEDSKEYCIITEGEIDALSFIQAGYKQTISVPNGAKANNLTYLDSVVDKFEKIKKVYIASDCDEKGFELRDELIRRIGPEKCFIIEYQGLKDANELLCKNGSLALNEVFNNARFAKIEGLVDLSDHYNDLMDLFNNGIKPGALLKIEALDNIISWELGRLAIFTGIPGHGKSEFVDFVVTRLNALYQWKAAYFSPENYPIKYHLMKLIPKITGKKFDNTSIQLSEFNQSYEYIHDNYQFIAPDDEQTFERIIELAIIAVKRYGIKILVIDPYNKIEHCRDRNETETEYISRFLDKLIVFARQYNVLVILVAHPRKMQLQKDNLKKYAVPNLYDINGSANFYNKSDYGISVYRDKEEDTSTIYVQKVKFRHLGVGGEATFKYNFNNGRYENPDTPVYMWSKNNWITEAIHEEIKSDYIQAQLTPNHNFNPEFNEEPPF